DSPAAWFAAAEAEFEVSNVNQLLERCTISEEQRISQLLYHVEMGDRSPSDFYRYMGQLAGNSANL
uniref:Uncharacterized protein n=1 Tax=Anopheles epiroticus TaxID=199890 RepID=A0A182PWQ5_9DIPT